MMDLRAFTERAAHNVPRDVDLTVLVADPWTGNLWVHWTEPDGTPCRALTHESDLTFVAEHRRRRVP